MKSARRNKRRLTASEFSRVTGIASDSLYRWNDLGLLRPALRGKETSHCYYIPEQRLAARFIERHFSENAP